MTKAEQRRASEAGFNLIEMMFVLGLMGVLSSMAVLQMNTSRPGLKGDGGMRVLLSQLNQAREMAITQRRNMRLVFDAGNRVQIQREEIPGGALTTLSSVLFEGGVQYTLVSGVPDTPDTFGASSAVAFGVATEVKFSPEGKLINQSGAWLNGSLFLAIPNQKLSARAVTILGSTGRVRAYRWDGSKWQLV